MMEFDVLFSVIIRFEDESMDELDKKLEDYSIRLGDCIHNEYSDCFVAPIALDEAGNDLGEILKNFKIIEEE